MNTLYHDGTAAWGLEQSSNAGVDGGLANWSKRLLAENEELLNDLGRLSSGASWWKSTADTMPQALLDDSDDLSPDPESDLPI